MVQGIGKGSVGEIGEDIACAYLARKGYRIRHRNYRRKTGEIDIVAECSGVLHFIEVKSSTFGGTNNISREIKGLEPEELINELKIARVSRTAQWYVEEFQWGGDVQIDALIVVLDRNKKVARCRYYPQILG